MWSDSRCIAAGDVVILWMTREDIQPIVVTPGKELNGRYGVYRHSDLVGVSYGSKISSRNGRGFIHALRPTPELWTLALPHRTQILYHADISYITMWLGIKPGSVMVEAGTGSGSFSHSIARTIGPTGRLFSFEFHEQRANKAREEFARHGMDEFVVLQHRNVCKDGFGLQDEVDAVFLDLPAPWEAVASAKQALKKDRIGRICCFSPCIEQVLRTVSALNELGFTGVTMHETLTKPHDICNAPMQTVEDAAIRLRDIETRKEQRRLRQIESAARDKKRKRIEGNEEVQENESPKRTKMESKTRAGEESPPELDPSDSLSNNPPPPQPKRGPHIGAKPSAAPEEERYVVSKPFGEVRGHTSYLTFAMLVPSACDEANLPQEPKKSDTMARHESPLEPSETSATFDSLIAGIPEEVRSRSPFQLAIPIVKHVSHFAFSNEQELERMLNVQ
ncbi:tRNA (adenine-N(1))-methyltransferase catalytic subunit TRM61 [Rhizoctonia solani 123E]|uniref:tRNA (adenine(58)-N(1))-methyltransferase catalytic subunit TRM61 n=1 Tax=Rhizoctonia solani 123E TaxID=1423351 RepID=A0A074S6M5_9AGAM|nr:tRNA (adenine-N(1))-methyltransferase catalytic subunit TRM61 [Rhizoctonia solani 123E]